MKNFPCAASHKKSGVRVEQIYNTFQELYDAILENGPLVVASDIVDVGFFAVSGEFDGHIMAFRQSGRNVRRFLVRSDLFEEQYGTVKNCLDHIRSNNAVDCRLELKHLNDMAEKLGLSSCIIDPAKRYDRLEVDIVAALQLLRIMENSFAECEDHFSIFELGFCVGRLFSSAQNLVTLEPDASRAAEYKKSYKERGKKGKSKDRKSQRLDHLFDCISLLVGSNPAFSRLRPIEVGRLALNDAVTQNPKLWTQGRGQLDHYLTCFASDQKYRKIYRKLFPESG